MAVAVTVLAAGLSLPARAATNPCAGGPGQVVRVADAKGLAGALGAARPGEQIVLADGHYAGRFTLRASGAPSHRIRLCGSSRAVLDGGSTSTGYGMHLLGDYVDLVGFSITRSQKGVVLDGSSHTLLDGLTVSQIGDEAVHLRRASQDVLIRRSLIHHTGLRVRSYGEGVYVGSTSDSRCGLTGCTTDKSDRTVVTGNRFWALGAEAVDAKEGTSRGVVSYNTIDGRGSSAASWVDIKGNNWTVRDNRGTHSRRDGYSASVAEDGWGKGNTFTRNSADVDGPGFGLRVPAGNVVRCSNTVQHAGAGYANVTCAT